MDTAAGEITTLLDRLVDRLTGMNHSWYGGRTVGVDGMRRPRAEHLRALVLTLAELGRQAGTGAPEDAVPHALGVHALADQVAVLVRDILAVDPAEAVRGRTSRALRDCYDALWA